MQYERGMQIIYDVVRKGVFVEFRGSTTYLPGPFASQREAIVSAEEYCRERGWEPTRDD